MQENIKNLKNYVKTLVQKESFNHHKWYVKYHLEIVEQIAFELCEIYKNASKEEVEVLVWMHDFWKFIDFNNQYFQYELWEKKMIELWFSQKFAKKITEYIMLIDWKNNLWDENIPIEVKIVSSSDWASHMIWPFHHFYWYENTCLDFETLLKHNLEKLESDWNKKIVLPELKEKFLDKYLFMKEQFWVFPNNFLKCQK